MNSKQSYSQVLGTDRADQEAGDDAGQQVSLARLGRGKGPGGLTLLCAPCQLHSDLSTTSEQVPGLGKDSGCSQLHP